MGRVRITRPFVLLALAALLAPRVEASRTGVWKSSPPAAAALTTTDASGLLAPLAPAAHLDASTAADSEIVDSPRFDLGDVVLVESELEHEDHFDLGPLDLLGPAPLRGPPPSYPETRVRGFELLPPFRVGASPSLSLWSRQACGFACREVVSDSRYDPWGLCAFGLPCPGWAERTIDSVKNAAGSAVEGAKRLGAALESAAWQLDESGKRTARAAKMAVAGKEERSHFTKAQKNEAVRDYLAGFAEAWGTAMMLVGPAEVPAAPGRAGAAKAAAPPVSAGQGPSFWHYTDEAGRAGIGRPPYRINPSPPETMFSVNEAGAFDAGLIGQLDRSMTENVFLTNVPPAQIGQHAQRLLPLNRTFTHAVEVSADDVARQGFRLFENPALKNTFNIPCGDGVGPCVDPNAITRLPAPIRN